KKPSSLRWEYTSPTPSTVVMYDGKVTVSDANGGSQAKKGRMFRELATIIANVVSGKEFESEKNFKTQYYSNATSYWIKMTPATRRLKAFFNHIELTVDKARQVAVKMYMDEKEGDSTLITFSNHKVNVAIDDKMFKLK
ncbi:MAG: outer membrane lipoprotein carrier protein LolA, partial [Bacteroidales bacterium]|nr:outer membrane lipoprotein carrier protein LolA [Bacteroidales bacterium]